MHFMAEGGFVAINISWRELLDVCEHAAAVFCVRFKLNLICI